MVTKITQDDHEETHEALLSVQSALDEIAEQHTEAQHIQSSPQCQANMVKPVLYQTEEDGEDEREGDSEQEGQYEEDSGTYHL